MKIVDPRKFTVTDMPIFILADDLASWFNFITRKHEKDIYAHSMEMIRPGFVASQNLVYKEIPVERYMKKSVRMKFFGLSDKKDIDLYRLRKQRIITEIDEMLNLPWFQRRYDFVGILGQAIPWEWTRKFNIPYLFYCSERSAKILRESRIPAPIKPNPSELHKFYLANPDIFEYRGHWIFD